MFELPKEIFDVKVNKSAIFNTIISERAALRTANHKVKHRGEVRGGGAKPWKQKGTGRARAGSRRSPIWVGGGVVFGPNPQRNYLIKLNKKIRKLALFSALTLKAQKKAIIIKDLNMKEFSTKGFLQEIKALKIDEQFKKVLIITSNLTIKKSANNLKKFNIININELNVGKVVHADIILINEEAIANLKGRI